MDIVLVIGNEDPFLQNNQQLSTILHKKGISHHLYLWNERAHSGYYWRRMAPLYI
jgi:esterase/lipase superfamily enzyme